MGPTKVIVKDGAIYDAKTGKLLKDGLTTHEDIRDYADHHYIALPVVNKACEPWLLDGEPIYCLRGARYENLKDEVLHLARCPDSYSRRRTHGRIGLHSLCVLRP